jgi:phosphoenolpyruvate synthase/pyruvate phosphate dikinase
MLNTLDNLKKDDLTYFGERAEQYFCSYSIVSGMQDNDRLYKFTGIKNTVRWLQLNYYFYQFTEDLIKSEIEAKEKILKEGNKYVDNLIKGCLKNGKKLISLSKAISVKKIKDKNEFAKLILDYKKAISNYTVYYVLTFFEKPLKEITEEVIKRNTKTEEEYQLVFDLVTTSCRLTASEEEFDNLLKIAQKSKNVQKKSIENHIKKYGWLSNRYFIGDVWTKYDILKRLESLGKEKAKNELAKRLNSRKQREIDIKNAIRNFNTEDKSIIKQIRKIVYLRTQRGDFIHESAGRARPFLDKLAKELKITYFDLMNLSAEEIILSLNGHFDYKKHIEARKQKFLIFHDWSKKGLIIDGVDVDKYLENKKFLAEILLSNIEYQSEIKGYSAEKGFAKGKVSIIKTTNDVSKIKFGDVLVTNMTTANLIPAMEKASAFVTDEGGITCHAAIIAREMHKPCIIGTKIATKVLKDGDEVEVDADKGIVRILKKDN